MNQAQLTASRRTTANGVHVVTLAGEIDHTTTGTLCQALEADDGSARRTVIDFRYVTFIDSSGISALVAANNAARARGGWLRLAHTPKLIADLLHVVCLDDVISLHSTLEEALTAEHAA